MEPLFSAAGFGREDLSVPSLPCWAPGCTPRRPYAQGWNGEGDDNRPRPRGLSADELNRAATPHSPEEPSFAFEFMPEQPIPPSSKAVGGNEQLGEFWEGNGGDGDWKVKRPNVGELVQVEPDMYVAIEAVNLPVVYLADFTLDRETLLYDPRGFWSTVECLREISEAHKSSKTTTLFRTNESYVRMSEASEWNCWRVRPLSASEPKGSCSSKGVCSSSCSVEIVALRCARSPRRCARSPLHCARPPFRCSLSLRSSSLALAAPPFPTHPPFSRSLHSPFQLRAFRRFSLGVRAEPARAHAPAPSPRLHVQQAGGEARVPVLCRHGLRLFLCAGAPRAHRGAEPGPVLLRSPRPARWNRLSHAPISVAPGTTPQRGSYVFPS